MSLCLCVCQSVCLYVYGESLIHRHGRRYFQQFAKFWGCGRARDWCSEGRGFDSHGGRLSTSEPSSKISPPPPKKMQRPNFFVFARRRGWGLSSRRGMGSGAQGPLLTPPLPGNTQDAEKPPGAIFSFSSEESEESAENLPFFAMSRC